MTSQTPLVVVIAGPNGAGKSTLAPNVLQDAMEVDEFVNADAIARGLSEFHPERVAITAGKLMLERLADLVDHRKSFAFETTLSTRSFAPLIRSWKDLGFGFRLIYVWLPSADLSVSRVAARVKRGGHHIPEETIRRRYDRSLRNFFELYEPLADWWEMFDNRRRMPRPIARGGVDLPVTVTRPRIWSSLESRYASPIEHN